MSGEREGEMGTVWFCEAALRSSRSKLRESGEEGEQRKGEDDRCDGAAIIFSPSQSQTPHHHKTTPAAYVSRFGFTAKKVSGARICCGVSDEILLLLIIAML